MTKTSPILQDSFGREHTYLRISLTEKCNLRCTYCMPEDGVVLSPKSDLMTTDEVIHLAKLFVKNGVNKIRLTGGEPLLRKDIPVILEALKKLPVHLSITTNAVLVDRYIQDLKAAGVDHINVSLDTLQTKQFDAITKRNHFDRAYNNILLLLEEGFRVKLNVVLLKGVNDQEIIDFIKFTKENSISVRFIEFMPFDGNQWDQSKLVSSAEILKQVKESFGEEGFSSLPEEPNRTARNFKIKGYKGDFGIISTVTNPFCDTCNRIRLTANGKLKNCLFSQQETDLLKPLRQGQDIGHVIEAAIKQKKAVRAGMTRLEDFTNLDQHDNRSMITIGG
jgi:molybdenum cofactor biosynthesis protein A